MSHHRRSSAEVLLFDGISTSQTLLLVVTKLYEFRCMDIFIALGSSDSTNVDIGID